MLMLYHKPSFVCHEGEGSLDVCMNVYSNYDIHYLGLGWCYRH